MSILDIIILILVLGWLGGFYYFHVGGLIHLLIAIALVMLIYRLARPRA